LLQHRSLQRPSQVQRPAGASLRRPGARGGDQQGFLAAGQPARSTWARLLGKRKLDIALHEAAFGAIHGGTTDADRRCDDVIGATGIGRQQDLGPLELARRVLSAAQQGRELVTFGLAQSDPIAYVHRSPAQLRGQHMNHMSEPRHAGPSRGFTDKQGQYLAFIHAYTLVMDRPPAEADLQRHFGVTPPSVHGMVLSLERGGCQPAAKRRFSRASRAVRILMLRSGPLREAARIRRDHTSCASAS
jgi:hypothetical protein